MHKPPTDVEFHALFSTQEAIFKYICEGENPTLCFFDLEKAFDSIEYPRFQGVLNPLTGRSAFEVFVIPVLLYGCETWILTPALLSKLEKLQSEIGKQILKLSKYHADLAPIIGLHLPSIKAHIVLQKISFLASCRKV